ncbi:hypothetical protein PENFLA_c223G00392, partial [Penicillium flavigenum]
MHQSKGHSSSLVLTIRKLNLWELTRVALITLHYRRCKAMAYTLFLAPSLRTMQHGHPSSTVKYTVASGLFRQIEDKTKVAADERAPSRLLPRPHRLRTVEEFLNLWHRAAFIHHGSAIFIASGAAFLKRVQIRDELERDVAWLVTALQRV